MMASRPARAMLVSLLVLTAACSSAAGAEEGAEAAEVTTTLAAETTTSAPVEPTTTAASETTTTMGEDMHSHEGAADPADVTAAQLATAAFQDVEMAEAAGWGSTMDGLGCFENAEVGGMGLHYLNESLLDDSLDVAAPEALVYELDANGEIAGLIAHEYIVPVEAWTADEPPTLFGMEFHQHPVLPLWVLHAWLWKDNVAGFFDDWNPAVRLCPEGIPVFGVDLP